MNQLEIRIEKHNEGFWAKTVNCPVVLTSYGDTIEGCKQNFLDCIEMTRELDEMNRFPYKEGEYELVYIIETETASALS
ncbi:MAG: hypothetical protein LBF27_29050 [Sphingobacterium sp.]|jgi:hypothetical protein|nr:hypothetical protein [Sphingobacterium sp.]